MKRHSLCAAAFNVALIALCTTSAWLNTGCISSAEGLANMACPADHIIPGKTDACEQGVKFAYETVKFDSTGDVETWNKAAKNKCTQKYAYPVLLNSCLEGVKRARARAFALIEQKDVKAAVESLGSPTTKNHEISTIASKALAATPESGAPVTKLNTAGSAL